MFFFSGTAFGQDYTFEDFIGTWHGTISSETWPEYSDPISMTIESNGFYTETSGHLMPTIYPNSQDSEFDAPTNRYHRRYLQTVWAGQYFYQHFYYEVVYFNNDTLEMHYNYWDDPEPYPEVGTIFLVRENLTPAPSNLVANLLGNNVALNWNPPSNGGAPMGDLSGYNVYRREGTGTFELLEYVEVPYYQHLDISQGLHAYYVTAVFEEGESLASNEAEVEFILSGIDTQASNDFSIYPNPVSDVLNIRSESDMVGIRIFSQEGRLKATRTPGSREFRFHVDDLQPGLYVLIIETNEGAVSKRIVIQ